VIFLNGLNKYEYDIESQIIDLSSFFDMENEKKENKCLWARVKNAFSSAVEYLAYVKDQQKLWYHRRLAEGGKWAYSGVIVLTVVAVLLVAVSLLFRYGAFCASQWNNVPDYMEGKFPPDNVLDAAGYLLFTNGGQNLFDGAHWWGFFITCLGIVLVAFFTSKVTSRLERKAQRYLKGETWYRMRNHIVIFGVSDYLYSIIEEKTNTGDEDEKTCCKKQRFLIVTTQDVEMVRREVFSFLQDGVRQEDFVFLFGDRTSNTDISKLSLRWAKEVFIIGDSKESDDIESYRDANNMDCIKTICDFLEKTLPDDEKKLEEGIADWPFHVTHKDNDGTLQEADVSGKVHYVLSPKRSPLPCHVMFEYQTTFAAFQFCDIPDKYKDYVNFLPFNYYDLWARKVIVGGEVNGYKFLDTLPGSDGKKYITEESEEFVHLIVLGMTKMGIAMALQAAHVCHYPNFISAVTKKDVKNSSGNRKRTRITFVDSNADLEMDYFKGRFTSLMQETRTRYLDFIQGDDYVLWQKDPEYKWSGDEKGWYDIEWEFIKGRIESNPVRNLMEKAVSDSKQIVTVAVCLSKSHQSIAAAMYLPEKVLVNSLQVLAFQRRSGTILDDLSGKMLTEESEREKLRYKRINPFGMFAKGYDLSLDNDSRAKMVSYVYDSYYALKPTRSDWECGNMEAEPTLIMRGWDECDVEFSRYHSKDGFLNYSDEEDVCCLRYTDYDGIWRRKQVDHKMSCMFNANSIGTKLRGIGIVEEDIQATFNNDQVKVLARVEHNRWNIEKMLTGYRALTSAEVNDLEGEGMGTKLWKKKRKEMKDWPNRAHLDICSVEELQRREMPDTIALDASLSQSIPAILKEEKRVLKERKNN